MLLTLHVFGILLLHIDTANRSSVTRQILGSWVCYRGSLTISRYATWKGCDLRI